MFSKTCSYALKIMIFLASVDRRKERVSVKDIADGIGSPKAFTAKVLQQLSKSKLIRSIPGPGGGYYLPEDADYNLVEIMAAINEDHVLTACALGFEECSSANPCPVHHQFVAAREEMRKTFDRITISRLSKSVEEGKSNLLE
ncbi:RrF2 family transcriptional regulator [Neolewinella persica]|uniref:RrF2 family transcriptional regulator n=1 Tax=Neolewinella persica TaxID=70998 RepID=UPI000362C384|nr:Rrf2 family transcriptional regulator [Neolewinella persica]